MFEKFSQHCSVWLSEPYSKRVWLLNLQHPTGFWVNAAKGYRVNSVAYNAKGPFPISSCTGQNVNNRLLLLHYHQLKSFSLGKYILFEDLRVETFVAEIMTQTVHMLRIWFIPGFLEVRSVSNSEKSSLTVPFKLLKRSKDVLPVQNKTALSLTDLQLYHTSDPTESNL